MNRDKYIEQYYQAIIYLEDIEDIKEALPEAEYTNFPYLIEGLIERLKEEKENLQNKDFLEEEFNELVKPEIQLLEEKINICNQLKKETEEDLEIEKKSENVLKKDLIFATTPRDNIFLEEDLKNIPKEYYEKVLTCIEKLENNVKESNNEKAKGITNNAKLKDIHVIKEFKIRLYYEHLTPDTAYVILAKTKKSDNDKIEMEPVKERKKKTKEELDYLKKAMKNEEVKRKIIEENLIIKERIKEALSQKGRKRHE